MAVFRVLAMIAFVILPIAAQETIQFLFQTQSAGRVMQEIRDFLKEP